MPNIRHRTQLKVPSLPQSIHMEFRRLSGGNVTIVFIHFHEMAQHLDIAQLITLVQTQPVLWNKMHGRYKDKISTQNAWAKIFKQLYSDFNSRSEKEKKELGKNVMKKWWNIRDGYVKSCKRHKDLADSGAGTSNMKKYVYYDKLQFLSMVTQKQQMDYKLTATETTQSQEGDNSFQNDNNKESFKKPRPTVVSKKRKVDPVESRILEILEGPENRHLSFYKSIIPSLDTFDEDEIIQFQIGVMQLLSNMKNQKKMNIEYESTTTNHTQQPPVLNMTDPLLVPSQSPIQTSPFYEYAGSSYANTPRKSVQSMMLFDDNDGQFPSGSTFSGSNTSSPLSTSSNTTMDFKPVLSSEVIEDVKILSMPDSLSQSTVQRSKSSQF